jgi:hypothetical protein
VLEGQRAARVDSMVGFAAALAAAPREDVESPALTLVLEGWLHFTDGVVATWLAGPGELSRAQVRHLLRESLLAALASVAGVDDRAAATRLARGAAALRMAPAPAAV